jgi:beta-glucosidase
MSADGKFPEGFIWGAATAAHQVEGDNTNTDIWTLEQAKPSLFKEPSADAIDQWNRYDDDLALLSALGLQAYRFSIEWARIEPEEGYFSRAALEHYQRLIDACLKRGLAPVPTFHHFTLPLWQARNGGFTDPRFAERFARYCDTASRALEGFEIACTINELNLPLFITRVIGRKLSGEEGAKLRAAGETALGAPLESTFLFAPPEAVMDQGLKAHALARDAIKANRQNCKVGVTLSIAEYEAEPGGEAHRDAAQRYLYEPFLEAARKDDFIGVQTYTRVIIGADGRVKPATGRPHNVLGWEDRPEALAATCRYVWDKTRAPIIVTENGWAGNNDARRCAFIREALSALKAEIDAGVDVRGYLYWSLLDNFEWLSGYGPKFGLIGVDRATQRRELRASALLLGAIARRNSLQDEAAEAEPEAPVNASGEGPAQVGLG